MPHFTLTSAFVHYGSSRYPLQGLDAAWGSIESAEAVDAQALAEHVGQLTGFERAFEIRHFERKVIELEGRPGEPLIVPECILAQANGYSIRWDRAA